MAVNQALPEPLKEAVVNAAAGAAHAIIIKHPREHPADAPVRSQGAEPLVHELANDNLAAAVVRLRSDVRAAATQIRPCRVSKEVRNGERDSGGWVPLREQHRDRLQRNPHTSARAGERVVSRTSKGLGLKDARRKRRTWFHSEMSPEGLPLK